MPSATEKDAALKYRARAMAKGAIECQICGYVTWGLLMHARRFHRLTREQYAERFPDAPFKVVKPANAPRNFEQRWIPGRPIEIAAELAKGDA